MALERTLDRVTKSETGKPRPRDTFWQKQNARVYNLLPVVFAGQERAGARDDRRAGAPGRRLPARRAGVSGGR